jgi:hypothetical protein
VRIQLHFKVRNLHNVWQVPFIVLHNKRHGCKRHPVFRQVVGEVFQAFNILFHLSDLAVGDEYNAISALKNQLARCVVIDLPGHGIKLEFCTHPGNLTEVERQEIEKESAVAFGCNGCQVTLGIGRGLLVDNFQVRRFSTHTGAVVNDLAVDFFQCKVYLNHLK